ncbi:hypothetical protein [Paraburkholderia bryophila]|uniref:Uncharacterized protein n=1 Tax=Paraburkholderia bryophila TaxID=420952 RepID=A0A7Y9W3L8_9BURK|nr:hypothetical protein [Paraburkholderia bryophila]NYH13125.1 hypothetical protein [Paraburkholderia bryophila]
MLGGEATNGPAKGESGGHPITGVGRIKRGFPDAPTRPWVEIAWDSRGSGAACARLERGFNADSVRIEHGFSRANARRALVGGPLSFYGPFR